jgi:2-polyprenyl-6-methoxyphenol hydroxylase-like FAD-dependent oxidoreductase
MGHAVVVGAGPAGAGLAHLLAHRGVDVTLVERQSDFAREFRGEVLMPSGIAALEQIGVGGLLDRVPCHRPDTFALLINRAPLASGALDPDFFRGRPPLAVSQPGLLEAMVEDAETSGRLRFLRGVSVKDVHREGDRVVGVRARSAEGEIDLRGDLVVGTDGRASVVRRRGQLDSLQTDLPMDIVWCKVPCPDGFTGALGALGRGHLLVAYRTWDGNLQVGWVILKGTFGELRQRGIENWVGQMADHVSPELGDHLRACVSRISHPFLLDTVSDRVARWSSPGSLVLGDAAHTMSPVGGQGLNIALRDAVVAANHLVPVLARNDVDPAHVDAAARAIELERTPEVRTIQRLQAFPPRVVLSRAWWGEPLRRLAAAAFRTGIGLGPARSIVDTFAFGVGDVRLHV